MSELTRDPVRPPEREELAAYLGAAAPLWETVVSTVRKLCPSLEEVWSFAGPGNGWSLRLVEKSRVLVYLTPGVGQFRVGLVLGAKGVEAARVTGLSNTAAGILDAAPKQAEGYGVRFQVCSVEDLGPFNELFGIKLAIAPRRQKRRTRGA